MENKEAGEKKFKSLKILIRIKCINKKKILSKTNQEISVFELLQKSMKSRATWVPLTSNMWNPNQSYNNRKEGQPWSMPVNNILINTQENLSL